MRLILKLAAKQLRMQRSLVEGTNPGKAKGLKESKRSGRLQLKAIVGRTQTRRLSSLRQPQTGSSRQRTGRLKSGRMHPQKQAGMTGILMNGRKRQNGSPPQKALTGTLLTRLEKTRSLQRKPGRQKAGKRHLQTTMHGKQSGVHKQSSNRIRKVQRCRLGRIHYLVTLNGTLPQRQSLAGRKVKATGRQRAGRMNPQRAVNGRLLVQSKHRRMHPQTAVNGSLLMHGMQCRSSLQRLGSQKVGRKHRLMSKMRLGSRLLRIGTRHQTAGSLRHLARIDHQMDRLYCMIGPNNTLSRSYFFGTNQP
jgi:hypothetical protein